MDPHPQKSKMNSSGIVGGLILIVVGLFFFLRKLFPEVDFGNYWPLLLIVIGAGIIWSSRKQR
jgi:hypothetical protein